MFLHQLHLLHFKNHQQRSFSFCHGVNCLTGKNGAGKTNILDAIYYLCLTKSYFHNNDARNAMFGSDFFRLDGHFTVTGVEHRVTVKFAAGKKKELFVNDAPVQKLTDFVGRFPVVMVTPDDNHLVTGYSEERRKLLDATLSQVSGQYLQQLMMYNRYLAQRNAALRQYGVTQSTDHTLLQTYDAQLSILGTAIYEARREAVKKLQEWFNEIYPELSLSREQVSFSYISQLSQKPLHHLLAENMAKDIALQRTECGIHRDDLEFYIGNHPLRRFGSQGQQKSFTTALKLAQHRFISQAKGHPPLLLIDDISDKLDSDRSARLLQLIASGQFGQVFITDTDRTALAPLPGSKVEYFTIGTTD
ncbi:MAG: DNA replication/repair protein RecF [Chitinophagales bacterium]|nr:DNA replication/repair protein RecF [Chitinophagales bacterium]MDW8418567.1 DNA replication/repair protein RecF [Chitinophagales bacterium]